MPRSAEPPEPAELPSAGSPTMGRWWHILFALTLIPLTFSLLQHNDDTLERFQRTLEETQKGEESEEGVEKLFYSEKDFFNQLPEHKIYGAHLPWDTWRHWIYALEAAAIFGALLYLLFPRGKASMRQGLLIAAITATGGILFLIVLQAIAAVAAHCGILYGGSIIVVIFWIVKFIGFSYQAALDPGTGFLLSFLGFTFGVGLCEEMTKALPALFHARGRGSLDWQGLCFWGLASGIGFGLAEGIMYSSRFYNGIATADAYCVRFISCVALHAVWGGSTALMIWHWRERIEADSEENIFLTMLGVLAVPMVLHGLYDTCLKRDLHVAALATALASFAWLITLVEWSRRKSPAAAAES
jgi:RsiW-degrading membrane proteinase PrsW (M82 family)